MSEAIFNLPPKPKGQLLSGWVAQPRNQPALAFPLTRNGVKLGQSCWEASEGYLLAAMPGALLFPERGLQQAGRHAPACGFPLGKEKDSHMLTFRGLP